MSVRGPLFVRRADSLLSWLPPSCVLVLALLAAYRVFGGYTSDDDLLVLRYAERFVSGDGLTWTDGERAHAITSFLLLGFVVALRLLGVPSEFAMSTFSSLATLAASVCVVVAARREGFSRWVSCGLGGALVLFAPFSVWATAGIGGAVFAAVTGWAVLVAVPAAKSPSFRPLVVLLCVLQLVRPDAPLVVVCVLVLAAFASRGMLGVFARRVVFPVLIFGALFAAAQAWYFGTPLPHLAGVKIAPDLSLTRVGVLYVFEFVRGFFPLLLLAAAALPVAVVGLRRSAAPRVSRAVFVLGPLFPALVWVLYLVWVGGDWMPGSRHFALVLLLLMVSLVRFGGVFRARVSALWPAVLVAVSLVTGAVSINAPAAMHRARDERTWLEFNCAGAEALGRLFAGVDPLLAAENVGCVPYVTGFRSLDMLGLADVHISRARPTGRPVTWDEWAAARLTSGDDQGPAGMFPPGHGNGDGAYVWGREPDLIATCDPVFPYGAGCFRSWREMLDGFDFLSRYRLLTVRVDVPFEYTDRYGLGIEPVRDWRLWNVWVRHDAGPLGVRYDESGDGSSRVVVPSWLLTAPLVAPLEVGADGSSRVSLAAGARVPVPSLVLAASTFEVVGLPAGVSWDVQGRSSCASRQGSRLEVSAPGCRVDLVLRANTAQELGDLLVVGA